MFVLSIAVVGLFIALLYHVVDVEQYYTFSIILDSVFTSSLAFFVWITVPLLSIPLFIRS